MNCEIITIGNELTSGRTLDLNSWHAAGKLISLGLCVTRIISVGNDYKMVSEALTKAIDTSRFVVITGGLGCTDDDKTNKIVAKALKRPLSLNKLLFEQIKSHAESRGTVLTPSLEKMAWIPEGSRILNPQGAICGFSIIEKDTRLYFLPGVPDQMRHIMDKYVLPEILSLYETLPVMQQRVLKLYGLDEPRIAEILNELKGKTGDIIFGFYPSFPENHITLSLWGKNDPAFTKQLGRVEKEIRHLIGSYIFATDDQTMEEVVGHTLKKKNMTISIAESCTGGLIGHKLTNVSGSSKYFSGGVVAYSNQSKVDLLHVSTKTLENHGAVSDKTVQEMARGVKKYINTDLGLAVTGIAGPDGGTKDKPVGTVHIGLAAGENIFSEKYRFWGTREQVKLNSAIMALDSVRRHLNEDSFLPGI